MSDISESDSAAPALTTPQEWLSYLREYTEVGVRANTLATERWMGHDPATQEAVMAAEQRLGVRFPPTYRSFLLATDGWDNAGGWVGHVYSCASISWLRDTDWGREFIDLYSDDDDGNDEYVAVFRRTLKVTNGEDFWFLDPTKNSPDGEWIGYLFRPKYGELERFASFADLWHQSRRTMEALAEKRAARE
jgi:hypothetical protein